MLLSSFVFESQSPPESEWLIHNWRSIYARYFFGFIQIFSAQHRRWQAIRGLKMFPFLLLFFPSLFKSHSISFNVYKCFSSVLPFVSFFLLWFLLWIEKFCSCSEWMNETEDWLFLILSLPLLNVKMLKITPRSSLFTYLKCSRVFLGCLCQFSIYIIGNWGDWKVRECSERGNGCWMNGLSHRSRTHTANTCHAHSVWATIVFAPLFFNVFFVHGKRLPNRRDWLIGRTQVDIFGFPPKSVGKSVSISMSHFHSQTSSSAFPPLARPLPLVGQLHIGSLLHNVSKQQSESPEMLTWNGWLNYSIFCGSKQTKHTNRFELTSHRLQA